MWFRRPGAEKLQDVKYLSKFYWSRLLSTAGCWFFWDFGFYGNKIFQSEFISVLTGGCAFLTFSSSLCDEYNLLSGHCASKGWGTNTYNIVFELCTSLTL